MANQTKSISSVEALASQPSSFNFLVENGGGVKRLSLSKMEAKTATVANALASPSVTPGATIADLKAALLAAANAPSANFNLCAFRIPMNYSAFQHFNDDAWALPSTQAYNTAWIVIGRNQASSFDYVKFMATCTSGDYNTYFVTCNNGTWTCKKVATAEP